MCCSDQLRADAQRIWRAGIEGVQGERLIKNALRLDGSYLMLQDEPIDLKTVSRICVVGAGKACAAMALAVEQVLRPCWQEKDVHGWVNVPADCLLPTERIELYPARPAGRNEPTEAAVAGTCKILELLEKLTPADLCLCLISGGGSALLVAPEPDVTLQEKIELTRALSAAGADIEQLNTVRKQLSRVKGGGLRHACRAGRLRGLILSDVMGDPLDVIASGPTVEDTTTAQQALAVLDEFRIDSPQVRKFLKQARTGKRGQAQNPFDCDVQNHVIGNNALAVDCAGVEAERLGYSYVMESNVRGEPTAEEVGSRLAQIAVDMSQQESGADCFISGGEPTVQLIRPEERGLGGRNQQLVLAAAKRLVDVQGIVLLSGGTDGEDGPTDAAGAMIDAEIVAAAQQAGLSVDDFLRRNDAYHFFEPLGALLKTGPTQTNVCDLRVIVAS